MMLENKSITFFSAAENICLTGAEIVNMVALFVIFLIRKEKTEQLQIR